MDFQHYRDEDYGEVCAFLLALNAADRRHINWNWARFEWMIEHPLFDRNSRSAIGLWRDGRRVVGAAIYDHYFGEAFCAALPAYEALLPEILNYAARELSDEAGLAVAFCDESEREIEAAAALGFEKTEQHEIVMARGLDGTLPYKLPDACSLAEFEPGGEAELRAIQWLFWQGFDHGSDREAFEKDFRESGAASAKRRVHFDPRLSLAARAPDGELAAYVCLWFDPRSDYAYLEPLCTIPAQRGKGLARALVFEGLNRAYALGARRAYVISDMVFYEKFGFEKEWVYTFYRKRPKGEKA